MKLDRKKESTLVVEKKKKGGNPNSGLTWEPLTSRGRKEGKDKAFSAMREEKGACHPPKTEKGKGRLSRPLPKKKRITSSAGGRKKVKKKRKENRVKKKGFLKNRGNPFRGGWKTPLRSRKKGGGEGAVRHKTERGQGGEGGLCSHKKRELVLSGLPSNIPGLAWKREKKGKKRSGGAP